MNWFHKGAWLFLVFSFCDCNQLFLANSSSEENLHNCLKTKFTQDNCLKYLSVKMFSHFERNYRKKKCIFVDICIHLVIFYIAPRGALGSLAIFGPLLPPIGHPETDFKWCLKVSFKWGKRHFPLIYFFILVLDFYFLYCY